MFLVYRFLTTFFYPIFVIIIFIRKLTKKEDGVRYKEKIFPSSFFPKRDSTKKLIWFHAASIGEVQSILPIIFKLNQNNKNLEFLITTVTLSSGNFIKNKIFNYPNISHRYFPVDSFFLIKEFLNAWSPNLILFVDSEIWPNLIFETKKRNISTIIINGRITKKTFKRWMVISHFAKKIFNCFDLCLASNNESKKYLERLNAKNIKYFGNIKLAGSLDIENINNENESLLSKNKFWCAASTHKGEELFCLKTHLNIKKIYKNIITIIIPRHINRTSEINLLCRKLDLNSQILNSNELIQEGKEVIIINSFGVLPKYFKYSKSVFIGKSILKKFEQVGGQSPIEAAKLGCKVYHGPYVYNFSEIYSLLKSFEISREISDEKEISEELIKDLKTPKLLQNNTNQKINDLGNKILLDNIKEINNFL